jgi:hypothetical protein
LHSDPVIDYRACSLQRGFGAFRFVKLDNDMKNRIFDFQSIFSEEIQYSRAEIDVLREGNIQSGNVCACCMPTDKQNPGFDSVIPLQCSVFNDARE